MCLKDFEAETRCAVCLGELPARLTLLSNLRCPTIKPLPVPGTCSLAVSVSAVPCIKLLVWHTTFCKDNARKGQQGAAVRRQVYA